MNENVTPRTVGEPHVYLMGHTPFKQYLDFMTNETVDAQNVDRRQIADDWRAAHEYIKSLQESEPAWADSPPARPFPRAIEPLLDRAIADPVFQKAFATVPVDLGQVELDRLVVRQKSINLVQVKRLKEQLGPDPSLESAVRLCFPFERPVVPYRYGYVSDNSFVFVSESNDIRILDTLVLRPEQIQNYQTTGPIAGVVAVVVGYGSNYLNAIEAEGRMVLNNGSHRAYALRDLGFTHAPCVIQKVTSREELEVVGAGALKRNPDLYLKTPRPPVLKDYFDPKLSKVVHLPRTGRHVRVHFRSETLDVPEQ